jgi:3-methyladenine DNA glycosylase/8-oxoguanine DNA glycosylase
VVEAWGPGASWALEHAPELIGERDDVAAFRPRDAVLADLAHRFTGLRLSRSEAAFEALVPAILEQKITGLEASHVRRRMAFVLGRPAPGPAERLAGLRLPPAPERLAGLAYFDLHPLGLERRRAEVIIGLAGRAVAIERLGTMTPADARARLERLPGVGPWTAAEVARVAWGDPDAVSIGDYHLPSLVAFALAGERRADDARLLKLLEPYRGQRGRVQRLLELSGIRTPQHGPHTAARAIDRI